MERLNTISNFGVTLRTIEAQDIEMLRCWRNDPKISQFMLTQGHITSEAQTRWFAHITSSEMEQHFIILFKGRPIGAANVKAISGHTIVGANTIEPGLYIYDDRYRGSMVAFFPALLLNDYCFTNLRCTTLQARVLCDNLAAIRFNRTLGYEEFDIREGDEYCTGELDQSVSNQDVREIVHMRLNEPSYLNASKKIRRLVRQ